MIGIKEVSIGMSPTKRTKQLRQSDKSKHASRYTINYMKEDALEVQARFIQNLAAIRTIKGLSAREMSLSLGQGPSYINDIENGRALPSLAMFFEICEYLKLTPLEFFQYAADSHKNVQEELKTLINTLSKEDLVLLLKIAERMQQKR